MRLTQRASVDLPDPDRPMMTEIDPLGMLSDTLLTPRTALASSSISALLLPSRTSLSASCGWLPKILYSSLISILLVTLH